MELKKDFVIVDGNMITVGVKSKPVGGKANAELIKKIAKHFGISPSAVAIRSGARSKTKIVEINHDY